MTMPTSGDLICERCGTKFKRKRPNGRVPRYCETPCRTAANNARKTDGGAKAWPRSPQIEQTVIQQYLDGLSTILLAVEYGVAAETIARCLRRNGVVIRHRNAPTAAKLKSGGRVTDRSGYIWLLMRPDDPLYPAMAKTQWGQGVGRYALEHRVVMARYLGRPLFEWETVHHKNGRRADNALSNLELWVVPQPKGQRAHDLALWVIQTYPEMMRQALAQAVAAVA